MAFIPDQTTPPSSGFTPDVIAPENRPSVVDRIGRGLSELAQGEFGAATADLATGTVQGAAGIASFLTTPIDWVAEHTIIPAAEVSQKALKFITDPAVRALNSITNQDTKRKAQRIVNGDLKALFDFTAEEYGSLPESVRTFAESAGSLAIDLPILKGAKIAAGGVRKQAGKFGAAEPIAQWAEKEAIANTGRRTLPTSPSKFAKTVGRVRGGEEALLGRIIASGADRKLGSVGKIEEITKTSHKLEMQTQSILNKPQYADIIVKNRDIKANLMSKTSDILRDLPGATRQDVVNAITRQSKIVGERLQLTGKANKLPELQKIKYQFSSVFRKGATAEESLLNRVSAETYRTIDEILVGATNGELRQLNNMKQALHIRNQALQGEFSVAIKNESHNFMTGMLGLFGLGGVASGGISAAAGATAAIFSGARIVQRNPAIQSFIANRLTDLAKTIRDAQKLSGIEAKSKIFDYVVESPAMESVMRSALDNPGVIESVIKNIRDKNFDLPAFPKAGGKGTQPGFIAPGQIADDVLGKKKALISKELEPLAKRVSGNKLLEANDLIDEIKGVGAKVDDAGFVQLFHHTNKQGKDAIIKTGKLKGNEPGVFFTTKKGGQASGFGDEVIEFKIPAEKLELDDIFTNEAHLKIKTKKAGDFVDVKDLFNQAQ